ncbi:hypothetical protein T07_8249 [Trichinella nelsoni]|uniref:Uncharacterized protein n=1 Tax=Trichinella nelsoni TaxID=6336 RepID=A0A0V0RXB8_9BILA|nr:hypothetical protein T07_8249 [Trichinella nelsoni]
MDPGENNGNDVRWKRAAIGLTTTYAIGSNGQYCRLWRIANTGHTSKRSTSTGRRGISQLALSFAGQEKQQASYQQASKQTQSLIQTMIKVKLPQVQCDKSDDKIFHRWPVPPFGWLFSAPLSNNKINSQLLRHDYAKLNSPQKHVGVILLLLLLTASNLCPRLNFSVSGTSVSKYIRQWDKVVKAKSCQRPRRAAGRRRRLGADLAPTTEDYE